MITPILALTTPSWLSTALSSFGTFIVGALGKVFWDRIQTKLALQSSRIERLEKLKALVGEIKQLNDVQSRFINKLNKMISQRLNIEITDDNRDSLIIDNYSSLTPKELDLFITIRGMTSSSIKRNQDELLAWLDQNLEFKNNSVNQIKNSIGFEFSMKLMKLELHLNIWQDKYSVWMSNEKHASVTIDGETEFSTLLDECSNLATQATGQVSSEKRTFFGLSRRKG